MKSECIDYRELPNQNPLFLAYFYDFRKVSEFYRPIPQSPEEWRARARSVVERDRFPRDTLVGLLDRFNRDLGASEAALANLDRLADPGTVAVVTGQQVGLFGGPCYTAYKALTAVALVRRLRSWGIPAVPVFWLAADDSDFDEVRSTQFLDGDGELFTVEHPDLRSRSQQMAGTAPIGRRESWLSEAADSLERGLPSASIRDAMLDDYAPQRTFREAFARWISRLFSEQGLIFFDPLIEGYRSGLHSLFETAISRRAELVSASLERRDRLRAAGFEPQVQVEESETFLFWIDGLGRYKLESRGGEYRAKDRPKFRYDTDALLRGIGAGEVQVAPNVLLRPLVQDYLFPTIASVGGAAEVAYYAQVNAIAPRFGIEPVMLPRSAFTVVDRKSRRLLDKYDLGVGRVLRLSEREIAEILLVGNARQPVLERLEQLREAVMGNLRAIYEGSAGRNMDEPERSMTKNAESRILRQIDKVRDRFVAGGAQRDEVVRRHLLHLTHHLAPRRQLQERCLNFNYVLNDGGPDFIGRLIDEIDPECFAHKVLYL